MNRSTYRRNYLRAHDRYEKYATKRLLKVFQTWARRTNIDPRLQIAGQIEKNANVSELIQAYIDIYFHVGFSHGTQVGKDIDKEIKLFDINAFEIIFRQLIINYIHNKGLRRVTMIRNSFINDLANAITKRFDSNMPIDELTQIVSDIVDDPNYYRWQSARVARTETTAAMNFGGMKSADQFGFVLDKEWLSAHDNRVRTHAKGDRYDHREMDGKKVARHEPFVFNNGFDSLQYPGDPEGEAGNIINCRCSVIMVPRRDKNGRLVRL